MKSSCRHQRKCSGCPRIHLPEDKQLALKASMVLNQLKPFLRRADSGRYIGFCAIVKSPMSFGYRTSVKLCLGEEPGGRKSVGLYKKESKTVIDIPGCPVQDSLINAALDRLFRGPKPLPAPLYNHTRGFQGGRLKFLTLRVCPATGDLGIILSHTGVERRPLVQWLKVLELDKVSVHESIITRDDRDLVIGATCRYLVGRERLTYISCGHQFELPPTAFFQANFSLSGEFIGQVTKTQEGEGVQTGDGILLDLYGGFGAYGLASHGSFAKIHIVDGNEAAIVAARQAAEKYAYSEIVASYAAVEDFLSNRLPAIEASKVSHIIVNPPRSGLSGKVKSALCGKKLENVQQLTYVSCNSETLARDLVELTGKGRYVVTNVTPFDMFPQTEHVEVVVKLRRLKP